MNPVMNQSLYSDFFGSAALPVLEEIFWSTYEQQPSNREKLFKIVPTEREIWQYAERHDLPMFNAVAEGTEYTFERAKQGANKTLTVVKYGLGASISEEMVDDSRWAETADLIRKLGRSGRESQEIAAMNVINNGFSTTTTADGVALFSTAHTLPSGGTYRNTLSVTADLDPTSLDQALADMNSQTVGDSGIIEQVIPKILLVSPYLERYAKELIGSDLKADTTDNNMNPFKQDGLRVVVSARITDTDSWYLATDPDKHGLRIIQRTPMQTKGAGADVGFTTDSILYKSRYREAYGAVHGKGFFGVAGA